MQRTNDTSLGRGQHQQQRVTRRHRSSRSLRKKIYSKAKAQMDNRADVDTDTKNGRRRTTIERQDSEMSRADNRPRFKNARDLPRKILSNVKGTWSHDTVKRRLAEDILERVFKDCRGGILRAADDEKDCAHSKALRKLQKELRENSKVSYLNDDRAEDLGPWRAIMREHVESETKWQDMPWLDAEFYFYRRILNAIGYFDQKSANFGKDPFKKDKLKGLEQSLLPAIGLAKKLKAFDCESEQDLRSMIFVSLWGNRADLSIWKADDKKKYESNEEHDKDALLCDDTKEVCKYLASGKLKSKSISLVVDNAGFELVCDLALADALTKVCKKVILRVKAHPTFVSDATFEDVLEHIEYLATPKMNENEKEKDVEIRKKMASRWKSHLVSGRWEISPDYAWCQPQPFWDLPEHARASLSSDLSDTGLTIIKGDANYRRLLGDRLFDHSKDSFQDVVAYFPSPILALRSLKSELGCGMSLEKCEKARKSREDWMTCGVYGVAQFANFPARQTSVANAVVHQTNEEPFADSFELQKVLVAIANACAEISDRVQLQPTLSERERGYTGGINESGDVQKKLDVFCDDVFDKHLMDRLTDPVVKAYFSEERSHKISKKSAAKDDFKDFGASFVVVADPLDGSRNADLNIPVGSIFGVFRVNLNEKLEDCILKPGKELVAAGYAHYGKATSLVLVPGPHANAMEFCLDEKTKEFKLVKAKIVLPERGQVYSLNDAREPDWPNGLKKYITNVRNGEGETGKKYSARYICALTADFHRTLQEGGWCGNPREHLRLVYEANPLAFIARASGGRASDGERDILEIMPTEFHQKTSLFIGSIADIDEIETYDDVKQTEGGAYKI